MPQIEVTFDIDANGIVNVSAKDTATGKEQAMTITGGTALSKEELDTMVEEAEKFAAEDHKRREAAEARNQADNLAYQAEKTLEEHGDKVPEEDKQAVESAIEDLKKALEADDIDEIKQKTEALMQPLQKVGQAVYQQQEAAGGQAGEPAGEEPGDDDVVEGEVVDEGGG
jgi:molecular chaperone DnaK